MSDATIRFEGKQGRVFRKRFQLTDAGGTPFVWTGYTASMQVRTKASDNRELLALTSGSGITLEADGWVQIEASGVLMAAVPAGTHVYDFVLHEPGGEPVDLFGGPFVVEQGVTR